MEFKFRLATKHEEFFRSNSPTVRALVKSPSELAECVVRYEDDPGGYVRGRHEIEGVRPKFVLLKLNDRKSKP